MPGPAPKIDREKLRKLHAQGYSDSQLAKALGGKEATIKQIRARLGLKAHKLGGFNPGVKEPQVSQDEIERSWNDGGYTSCGYCGRTFKGKTLADSARLFNDHVPGCTERRSVAA